MNKITILGRLVKEPTLSYYKEGKMALCEFTVASQRPTKDKKADFIQCKAFGTRGEAIEKFLKKGSEVVIWGSLHQEIWKDKEGKNRSKYVVLVQEFSFTGGSNMTAQNQKSNKETPPDNDDGDAEFVIADDDDNLPF
jgi:single-strand DNA-binding protein